ncbi:unnamed protein product [Cylicostephanus goldi]|uniref:Uncharacterized protein n=1 Tax=Cylicostephanus goldi TaxID=71465 RepID=A0A3P7QLF7_CYLGO|nr:unnamed protein product [Cylicostephanus goldi]
MLRLQEAGIELIFPSTPIGCFDHVPLLIMDTERVTTHIGAQESQHTSFVYPRLFIIKRDARPSLNGKHLFRDTGTLRLQEAGAIALNPKTSSETLQARPSLNGQPLDRDPGTPRLQKAGVVLSQTSLRLYKPGRHSTVNVWIRIQEDRDFHEAGFMLIITALPSKSTVLQSHSYSNG